MPPASKHVATPRMLATPKKTLSTQLSKLSGLNTAHASGIGPSLPKESTVSCKARQAQEALAIRTVRAESIASKKMSVPTTNKSIFKKRPALRSNIQEKPAPVKPFLPKECAASRQAREAREAAARQNAFNINKRIVGNMADKLLLSKKTAMASRTQERASPGRTSSPKERGVSSLQAHIPVSVGKNRTDITSAATKPLLPKECAASRIARENRETIAAKQTASGHKNRTNHAPLPSSNSVLNARQRRPVSSISSTNTFLKDYPTVLEQREARDALATRTTISAREGSVVWSTSPRYVVSHQKNDNRDRFSMSGSSYATAATAKVPEKSGSSAKPLVPKECPESRRARLASEALAARKTLVGQRGSPIPNGLPGKYLSSAKTLSTSETHSACARTSLPPSKVHSATNSTQCIISTPDPYKERARKAASLSFRDQLDLNSASPTRSKPASRPKSMVSRLPIRVK